MRISDWSSDVCSSDLDIGFWIAEEAVLELSPVIDEGWRLAHYPVDLLCLVRGALQTGAGDPTERQRARILRPVGSPVAGGEQQQPRLHLPLIGAPVRRLAVNGNAEGRSAERRLGTERVRSCRARWPQVPEKKTNHDTPK